MKRIFAILSRAEKMEKGIALENMLLSFFSCAQSLITVAGIAFMIKKITYLEFYNALKIFLYMTIIKYILEFIISLLELNNLKKMQMLYTDFKVHIKNLFLKLNYENSHKPYIKKVMSSLEYNCDMYGGIGEIVILLKKIFNNILLLFIYSVLCCFIIKESCKSILNLSVVIKLIIVCTIIIAFTYVMNEISKKISSQQEKLYDDHAYNEKALNYFMTDIFGNKDTVRIIQQFGMETLIGSKVDNCIKGSINLFSKVRELGLRQTLSINVANYLVCIMLYGVLAHMTLEWGIELGTFSFFYGAILVISQAISESVDSHNSLKIVVSRLDGYFELCDLVKKNEKENIEKIKYEYKNVPVVEMKNVTFKYDIKGKNVLDDISISLYKGEIISVVGPNGAGKSTLVNCICGLLNPTLGIVLINGNDIKCLRSNDKEKIFGTVFQNHAYFPFTVGENIALSEQYDSKKIFEIIRKLVGENRESDYSNLNLVSDLSGGQKQQIAILRAMYKSHECYIFDEPEASLDIYTEKKMYRMIAELAKDKLCIIISHRMALCKKSDRILVMDEGKIIQEGTHEYLIKNCNLYKNMWNKRVSYYIENEGDTYGHNQSN